MRKVEREGRYRGEHAGDETLTSEKDQDFLYRGTDRLSRSLFLWTKVKVPDISTDWTQSYLKVSSFRPTYFPLRNTGHCRSRGRVSVDLLTVLMDNRKVPGGPVP